MNYRPSYAQVDLVKLKSNFTLLREQGSAHAFICPMVKADAYGHGAVRCARALREAGAAHLGVVLIEEGIELRQSGDRDDILIFGPIDSLGAQACLEHRLTPVISEWGHLEALDVRERMEIHLEFNTGMNRLGFAPDQAAKIFDWLKERPNIRLRGVCTHFYAGDDAFLADGMTAEQLKKFEGIRQVFISIPNVDFHALNSSAVVTSKRFPLGSRPGIALYGVEPPNKENLKIGLQPVLSIRTKIAEVRDVDAGLPVSYGPTFRTARKSRIAVVPFGYADGYRRSLSNRGPVLWQKQRAKVAGTVCMDYFMIDLTDAENAAGVKSKVGDEVVLLGSQGAELITAEDLAFEVGTIPYEILTGIGKRVPRLYVG